MLVQNAHTERLSLRYSSNGKDAFAPMEHPGICAAHVTVRINNKLLTQYTPSISLLSAKIHRPYSFFYPLGSVLLPDRMINTSQLHLANTSSGAKDTNLPVSSGIGKD